MRPISSIVPKKGAERWLYETLRHLQQAATQSQSGLNAVIRNEAPDGSGDPLVDTGLFFYKPGLAGGQSGYGGIGGAENLLFSSTANTTKGKIHLGVPTARLTIDEAQSLIGINQSSPTSTLHIVGSLSGSGSSIIPSSDINTNWEARGGASWAIIGGTRHAALATDDGETSMGTVNSSASGGTNPQQCGLNGTISPGATYVVTLRVASLVAPTTFSLAVTLIDSAGNGWATAANTDGVLTVIPTVVAGRPTFYTVTFTITCSGTPALTGATANSIRLWGSSFVGASETYLGVTSVSVSQSGSALIRWDLSSGTQSGGIDIAGRLGVGTGNASLAAEVTVIPDASSLVGILIKGAASQTGNLLEFRNSSDTLLSRFTSAGVYDGPITTVLAADFTDSTFLLRDNTTPSKIAKFECSTIAPSTTRTFTFPDASGTLPTLENVAAITGVWTFNPGAGIRTPILLCDISGSVSGTGPSLTDGSGFYAEFQLPSVGLTADRFYIFPDGSGSLVVSGVAASLVGTTGSTFDTNTSLSGASFKHISDSSRRLRFVLSGAAGNNNIVISSTAARTYTFRDLSGGVVLDSGSALTSGRVPFVTTGGALTDSSLFLFATASGLTLSALNLITDTTTGMKIGTATGQKLGFWNTTPIVQPTTAVAAATFVTNTSLIANDTATFDGYTIGQVVKALRNMGLLA